jgi:hypothetical protein
MALFPEGVTLFSQNLDVVSELIFKEEMIGRGGGFNVNTI